MEIDGKASPTEKGLLYFPTEWQKTPPEKNYSIYT